MKAVLALCLVSLASAFIPQGGGVLPLYRHERRAPHAGGAMLRVPVFPVASADLHSGRKADVPKLPAGAPRGRAIPLGGSITTTYEFFVNVTVGTPPQSFQLTFDTGSTDMVIYGADCEGCPANSTYFHGRSSSTFASVPCTGSGLDCDETNCWNGFCPYSVQYGGGATLKGPVGTDLVTIGALDGPRSHFGLIEAARKWTSPVGVDGIVGFAYKSLSSFGGESIWDTIVFNTGIYAGFSFCLAEGRGVLELGVDHGNQTAADAAPFDYTPVTREQWYSVWLDDLRVDNVSLGLSPTWTLNAFGVIVDSGTTALIVPDDVYAALKKHYLQLCAAGRKLAHVCDAPAGESLFDARCFKMTAEERAAFPSVQLPLWKMQAPLEIPSEMTLMEIADEPGFYCLTIMSPPADSGSLPVIIGDALLQNYHVFVDKPRSRIGFRSVAGCPRPN
eukprot:TRINITY_DN7606_c0_g1_i1.p1 TRINITY_DN7606_c0_g1~~TRINITY_DN7606_c0_g1_i1.p1  ORF type:complete len:455 (-),score=88.69 TRINITY_DN7606_c0_g1_i1:142-1482(-)